jgi:hypothetical protein
MSLALCVYTLFLFAGRMPWRRAQAEAPKQAVQAQGG